MELNEKNKSGLMENGAFLEREAPAPYQQWGQDLEQGAIDQMNNACRLPVSVAGAVHPNTPFTLKPACRVC